MTLRTWLIGLAFCGLAAGGSSAAAVAAAGGGYVAPRLAGTDRPDLN
jgi:hypothetical protein